MADSHLQSYGRVGTENTTVPSTQTNNNNKDHKTAGFWNIYFLGSLPKSLSPYFF